MHNFSDTGNVHPKQALFNIFRHNRIIHCTFNKVLKNIQLYIILTMVVPFLYLVKFALETNYVHQIRYLHFCDMIKIKNITYSYKSYIYTCIIHIYQLKIQQHNWIFKSRREKNVHTGLKTLGMMIYALCETSRDAKSFYIFISFLL